MKRFALAAVVAFACLSATATAKPVPERCTAEAFRPFSAATWSKAHWEREQPPRRVIAAQRRKLACAPPAHRKAMKRTWRADRKAFSRHRNAQLFRVRVTPFYGGGNWWAIPYTMVICESSARYYITHGAYSMTTPAWNLYNGPARTGAALAGEASERWQDVIAHEHWARYGEGGWECKQDGSVYW